MGNVYEPLHPEAHKTLLDAWRRSPRADRVPLPSGDAVEGFLKLEEDGAFCWNKGTKLPIELHLPLPSPGRVQLPDELDADTTLNMESYGSYLSGQEVAKPPPTNGGECECPICRCELKSDGGGNPPSSPNCMNGNAADPDSVFELQCGHIYHGRCLQQWFETRRRCPECQKDFGKVTGDQPRIACLEWQMKPYALPGQRSKETIEFEFMFPPGTSDEGRAYEGRRPRGYLPGNIQGVILLELFKVAFRRRVMFGLGNSMTTSSYRPTFNIHIKTSTHRGAAGHGYPDDDYFQRCVKELQTNGVTMVDFPGWA